VTETLTVSRGATDAMGNRTTAGTHTVPGVFAWRGFTADRDHHDSAGTTAELYVKRDADVQARDRITRPNGQTYAVVGHAVWEQNHPITGRDFGWKVFQVESLSG
jgi:hypothetical protein